MSSNTIDPPRLVETLIFDLGDVLFSWSPSTTTSIAPRFLRFILNSATWSQYQTNGIDQSTCYEQCGHEFGATTGELREALGQARTSLVINKKLVSLIKELREANKQLRVYVMSNIALDDYMYLREAHSEADWSIFDDIFTSGATGMRKPSLSFFKYVMDKIGGDPLTVMLIDGRIENLNAAQSCGLQGFIHYASSPIHALEQTLKNAVLDPIARGMKFLRDRKGRMTTEVEDGSEFGDNFTQFLILELSGDCSLLSFQKPVRGHLWNFFAGAPVGTTSTYPDDADTSSISLTIQPISEDDAMAVMDHILKYMNEDGIPLMYFDKKRARIDPFVCLNILSLFCTYGREDQIPAALDWVNSSLRHKAYLKGTRYYRTPELFPYFFHRVLLRSAALRQELGHVLLQHALDRIGEPGDSVARAIRVLIIAHYGEPELARRDLTALRDLQECDGRWDLSWVYMYGQSGLRMGNRGLSTAFALAALRAAAAHKSINVPHA